jgi:hypothetical protein
MLGTDTVLDGVCEDAQLMFGADTVLAGVCEDIQLMFVAVCEDVQLMFVSVCEDVQLMFGAVCEDVQLMFGADTVLDDFRKPILNTRSLFLLWLNHIYTLWQRLDKSESLRLLY